MGTTSLYMERYPRSALCARYAAAFSNEKQRQYLAKVIDDAAYCDTWQLYLEHLVHNTMPVSEEIILGAVARVGLDPESVPLWLLAASLCGTDETRQRVFALGQSVPLFNAHLLHSASHTLASDAQGLSFELDTTGSSVFGRVLAEERWPDRYANVDIPAVKVEVRQDWARLFTQMAQSRAAYSLSSSLRLQRIELAHRQMCAQLPDDDTSWYEYALFQLHALGDFQAAFDTVRRGLRACQDTSFALTSLLSVLAHMRGGPVSPPQTSLEVINDTELSVLLAQREAGEELRREAGKERLRELRRLGKHAAMRGASDWKLYSQWYTAEGAVACDEKMAAKVLENGMICCSAVARGGAATLGHEAIRFHLLRGQERESLAYAEQQAGLATHTLDGGQQRSAWNALVQTERVLHFDATGAENRRAERFQQSRLKSFIEKYRVNTYLPCSPELSRWIEFSDDLAAARRQEKETMLRDINAPAHRAVSLRTTTRTCCPLYEPQLKAWVAFTPPINRFMAESRGDADEVVGARELRGRWVYRVQINAATAARLRREARRSQRQRMAETRTAERVFSAMAKLVRLVATVSLSSTQKRRLNRLSVNWLLQQLTAMEQDLKSVRSTPM